jgi:hypothetical protein
LNVSQIKKLQTEKAETSDEFSSKIPNGKSSFKLINGIRGGFSQMAVMLEAPHLKNAVLVYAIQFGILFG